MAPLFQPRPLDLFRYYPRPSHLYTLNICHALHLIIFYVTLLSYDGLFSVAVPRPCIYSSVALLR